MSAGWFKHDSDASEDDKMIALRLEHGFEGIGIFWCIVERLRAAASHVLPLDLKPLAYALRLEESKLNPILDTCLKVGLFKAERGYFYSERLRIQMDDFDAISAVRRKSANARWDNKKSDAYASDLHMQTSLSNLFPSCIKEGGVGETKKAIAPRILMTEKQHAALVETFGADLVAAEIEKASDWSLDKGRVHKDGAAFMRNWLRRAQASARINNRSIAAPTAHERKKEREAGVFARVAARAQNGSAPTCLEILGIEPNPKAKKA